MYEVEARGFTPFNSLFDRKFSRQLGTQFSHCVGIPQGKELCTNNDATIRYMISVCITLNRVFLDPRCPVTITKNDNDLFSVHCEGWVGVSLSDTTLDSMMNLASMDLEGTSFFTSTSRAGVGMEDDMSFVGLPSVRSVVHDHHE